MMCSVYRLNRQPCHTFSLYITCQFILLAISISIKYLPYKKHSEKCKRRYINEKNVLWVFKKLNLAYKKSCDRVQFSSVAQSCPTLCDPMDRSKPGLPVHHQLLEFTQTHVHWVRDAIQLSHPLSSPSPPTSIFPSIRVFSNESALRIRWPKYWSFGFNISPSNEHSGLIFRMDWLALPAIQGILKSLLQHHSSKASILWHSTFFIVQLSHPYMTTGKTIGLTRQTFVGKVMSLLFNMLFF